MGLPAQGSSEWHAVRAQTSVRGSDCAVYEGMHPYLTTEQSVRQSVRAKAGAASEFTMVDAVRHGQDMEPVARKFLERLMGYKIYETGFVVHPEYSFIGASPDGLTDDGMGCCEFKCPYPRYTREPYSIFDRKRSMYKWQVWLQMECCDVDYCDFLCYLAKSKSSEPQFKYERVERHDNFFGELVSSKFLPKPQAGKVSRLDLYREWNTYINAQHDDDDARKIHLAPLKPDAELVSDADLDTLASYQARVMQIKSRISEELDALDKLSTASDQLKKVLGEKYSASITNGTTTLKIINKKPSIDFKTAFLYLGGEEEVLHRGEQMSSFNRTTGLRQISIVNGER